MNQNLNVNLINLRKSKGLEIADLATVLKLDEKVVKGWEYGTEMPNFDMLEKLAAFYGATASDLFIPMNIKAAKTVGGKTVAGTTSQNIESKGRFHHLVCVVDHKFCVYSLCLELVCTAVLFCTILFIVLCLSGNSIFTIFIIL